MRAIRARMPRSILVLPPMNDSIESGAAYSCLSAVSHAVGRRGYYVFPVAIVDDLLQSNGLPTPAEMHAVPREKLREVFGADAVLYLHVRDWGTRYRVVTSRTTVRVDGRLVGLESGETLWAGAWNAETNSSSGLGADSARDPAAAAVVLLASAVVNQVVATSKDAAHDLAAQSSSAWIVGPPCPLPVGPLGEDDDELRRILARAAAVGRTR